MVVKPKQQKYCIQVADILWKYLDNNIFQLYILWLHFKS